MNGMPRPIASKHSDEAIRFFLVSLVGLCIDIGAAWALIAVVEASDPIAAVAGFCIATVFNYLGHQYWTFQKGPHRASLRRFMIFGGVLVLTLVCRLLVLDYLGSRLPGAGLNAPLRLGLAAAVSFVVSYLLSRFFVFRDNPERHV